jgi:methylenetetrahydrofolate dehydrogenase (NADP+) / methenyltetrahydrofolate cyclohydrolase
MPTIKFDGRKEAEKIALFLEESEKLVGKSLVIFQTDGLSIESTYVRLKREMAERLGVLVTVEHSKDKSELQKKILEANKDDMTDGILVQLPVMGATKTELEQILSSINVKKDIDGLNPKSSFIPAVVVAVETVLEKINLSRDKSIAIVGSEGQVGKRLYGRLQEIGYTVSGFDKGDDLIKLKEFDVVIGCTGSMGLIKPEMVKEGFLGIDLGYPKGDISDEAIQKASFITPVPGGVGPLTIVSLFENLEEV